MLPSWNGAVQEGTAGLAGEVAARDAVLAEVRDSLGLLEELTDGGGALLGIETGLLVEVLVPDHHGDVGDERQRVHAAVDGAGVDVALLEVVNVEGGDVVRDVGEDALLHPVRDANDVAREDVGERVGLDGAANLPLDVVVGEDLQGHLVLVGGVVGLDGVLGLALQRGARPHGQFGAVVDALR